MAKAITKNNISNDFMIVPLSAIQSEAFHEEIRSPKYYCNAYYSHKKEGVLSSFP
jgi:hypothetical protein